MLSTEDSTALVSSKGYSVTVTLVIQICSSLHLFVFTVSRLGAEEWVGSNRFHRTQDGNLVGVFFRQKKKRANNNNNNNDGFL